jgi:monoamine oxidase
MNNWKILEASQRLGGRVRTSYLNDTKPEDYQYQEMGPMRFPTQIKYAGTNETLEIQDHKMVFQLADALNAMNENKSSLAVNFIPFIENSANEPAATSRRRPDGTVPGAAEVAANPALADNVTATYSNATAVAAGKAQFVSWVGFNQGRMKEIATNVFRAHKKAIKDGLFDYSESMYLRQVLHTDLNITDQIVSAGFEPAWPYEWVYFSATTWKTIDKGLSQLPSAFMPLVKNRTTFGISVSSLQWNATSGKISAHWRPSWASPFSMTTRSESFDYAVVAVPFSKVRLWRLPKYSSLLTRAINTLNYAQACKVALHYKSRFWEHLPHPIYGGCGSSDIPGIGNICYPSYQINSTRPGAILASYIPGTQARTVGAMSTLDHVAMVQRAMIETHGAIAAEQFTGEFDRVCWENNEFQAGAWCAPLVGQQELYLPAYYQTEKHTVFVGEHTSFTHAWISSALESAVRGVAQLLLDMGLVDEAKAVTETWMARWLKM